MKRIFLILTLFSISCASTGAIRVSQNTDRVYFAYDSETLTVEDSAVGFTASKMTSTSNPTNTAELVTFTVNCSSGTDCVLRFKVDGATPTSSAGMRGLYGSSISIYGRENIRNFKGIRETADDVVLDVTYWR